MSTSQTPTPTNINQTENTLSQPNDINTTVTIVTNTVPNNTENVPNLNTPNPSNTMTINETPTITPTITNINATIIQQPPTLETQTPSTDRNTNNNTIPTDTNNRKRSRDEMLNEQSNTNTNTNTTTPSNEEVILNVCVDDNNQPLKKMKLDNNNNINNNNNSVNATIPNANSEAFDENPYMPMGTSNGGYYKGKVLSRNQSDLKRYLNSMDEDVLKSDLLPKLCIKHKKLMELIKKKMSENTILCKIFIRSLSYDTQDKTVYDIFTKFGNVKEAVIVKDRQTGKSRGFGFITMSNASEAQAALVEHRKMIDGREAICNLASKPQGQKTSTKSKRDDHGTYHGHGTHHGTHHGHHRDNTHSHSHRKRNDDRNNNINIMTHTNRIIPPPPPPAPTYTYAHTNPYYDYNYQQAAATAQAQAQAAAAIQSGGNTNANVSQPATATSANAYNTMNPYANPYAQYAQYTHANTSATANTQGNNQNNANSNANTNIGNQPYVPAMAGQNVTANMAAFGANPYRFQ